MLPGPGRQKCTPYCRPGPGGTPLALRLTEGLGVAVDADEGDASITRPKRLLHTLERRTLPPPSSLSQVPTPMPARTRSLVFKTRFCRRHDKPELVCSVAQVGCSRSAWTTLKCLTTLISKKGLSQCVRIAVLQSIGNAVLVFKKLAGDRGLAQSLD